MFKYKSIQAYPGILGILVCWASIIEYVAVLATAWLGLSKEANDDHCRRTKTFKRDSHVLGIRF